MKYNFLKDATESLMDEDRVKAFQRAIARVVRPGDSVLECGTGTGILSMLACKEGARSVVATECDKRVYKVACANVNHNGFGKIKIVDNAVNGIVDVVIIEMLDTMLITKEQVKTINTLCAKGVIGERTNVIPLRASNFFEPIFYDFEFFDCHMPMIIQAHNANVRCMESLGQTIMYKEVNFNGKINPRCYYHGEHIINTKGWLNALKFSTVIHLTEELILGATGNLCMPVYVPVHEMFVKSGDVIAVTIEYVMSGGWGNLNVVVS